MAWPNVGPESFRSCSSDMTLNLMLSDHRRRQSGECHTLNLQSNWDVSLIVIRQRGFLSIDISLLFQWEVAQKETF